MRLLWFSNAMWSTTGYGVTTRVFAPRIKQAGHELAISAFYGLQGAPLVIDGIPHYPAGRDLYGNDVIAADAEDWHADAVISLIDVWVMRQNVMSQFKWFPWVPIDHDPIPPAVIAHLQPAVAPISFSEWGRDLLVKEGFDNAMYIPLGVDSQIYKMYDRREARAALGVPDGIALFCVVSANKGVPSRKAFDIMIRAFAEFHKHYPDTMLYIHSDQYGLQGENLIEMCKLAGLPKEAIAFPDAYKYARGMIEPEYLAKVYSASCALLHTTRSEGFGVAQIEAMACGCPVIATNFSAMPEIINRGVGWLVDYKDKVWTGQSSYQVIPDKNGVIQALISAYNSRDNEDIRQTARERCIAYYDADVIMENHWKPALAQMEVMIKETPPTIADKREKRREKRNGKNATPQVIEAIEEPDAALL